MTQTQQSLAGVCLTVVAAVVARYFLGAWVPRGFVSATSVGLGLAVSSFVFPYLNKRSAVYSLFLGASVALTLVLLARFF